MAQKQIFNDYRRFTKQPCAQKIIVLRNMRSVLQCFSVKQFAGQEKGLSTRCPPIAPKG